MWNQPQTEEQYIKLVQWQAEKQQKENIPSHQELINNYQKASRGYQEKECFYTVLLVLLVVIFAIVKLFPQHLGLSPSSQL